MGKAMMAARLAPLIALALVGCRNSTATISSQRLDAAPVAPHRLLVFADVGNVFLNKADGDEEKIFSDDVTKSLAGCGITVDYQKKRPLNTALTLDDSEKRRDDRGLSTSTFGADTILDIQWTSQNSGIGVAASANYTLTLFNAQARKPVWTAQMTFVSAWYGGQRYAATLVDRLKQDGLVPAGCVTPAVPKA